MKNMRKNMSTITRKENCVIVRSKIIESTGLAPFQEVIISDKGFSIWEVGRVAGCRLSPDKPNYNNELVRIIRSYKKSKSMVTQHLYWAIRHVAYDKHSHIFNEIEQSDVNSI
jgi:hypothetical protein